MYRNYVHEYRIVQADREKSALVAEVGSLNQKLDLVNKQCEAIQQQNMEMQKLMVEMKADSDYHTDLLLSTNDKLDKISDHCVPPADNPGNHGIFAIFRIKDDPKWDLYIVRCKKMCFDSRIKNITAKYPGAEIIKNITCQPNPANLFDRIREEIKKSKKVLIKSNTVKLLHGFNEAAFIEMVTNLDLFKKEM